MDAHPGGGPFNTARTIGRLEQPVAYLGRLSTDRFGETHERMLTEDGVGLGAIVRTDQPTTLALAEIDPAGSARYRFYARGHGRARPRAPSRRSRCCRRRSTCPARRHARPGARAGRLGARGGGRAAVGERARGCRPERAAVGDRRRARLPGPARAGPRPQPAREGERGGPGLARARAAAARRRARPARARPAGGARHPRRRRRGGRFRRPRRPRFPPRESRWSTRSARATPSAAASSPGGTSAALDREALADHALVVEATRYAALVAALTCTRAGASPPRLHDVRAA